MKILAIHRYFWPDTPPYASFLRSIGERWANDGHRVDVITSQPSYTSAGELGPRPSMEKVDSLRVYRVAVFTEGGRLPGQLLNLVAFPAQVAARILTGQRRDMIICSTAPQVTLGFAVSVAARLRGSKFVYHCMDLHPEIGRLSGEFSNPLLYRVLEAIDRGTMRRAAKIVVLSDDMRSSVIARDAALAPKIEVINNFSLPEFSNPEISPILEPAEGVLRIVFTGNLGRFQKLDTVIEALSILPIGTPVELVFMGEGKAKSDLQIAAQALAERPDVSVSFLPHGSPAAAKALIRSAHLGLVALAPEVVKYAYPSKTATYVGQGIPLLVLCETESELARTVRDSNLGLVVPSGDALAAADAVAEARRRLTDGSLNDWKSAVTALAESRFYEPAVLDQWAQLASNLEPKEMNPDMSNTAIIVGAPRSGTNMLRDVLTSLDGFVTWPCDEINLMWKHGNLHVPHDELTPQHARPEVKAYLRDQFQKLAKKHGAHTVVEKTCATSLRVGFTAEVFPDAKYIFIRRDGVDAAPSAMKRWNAPFDFSYTLKKVRWVPLSDLPRHLLEFSSKKLKQLRAGDMGREDASLRVATWWGPRPADFGILQRDHPLDELSIIQWQRCVESSLQDLGLLPESQVLEVVYEEFVRDPENGLREILEFLGYPDSMSDKAVQAVTQGSVGKGRAQLGAEAAARLDAIARTTLEKLGYV